MDMLLYNNKTDKRYINKTLKKIGDTLTGVYLKDETQVVNPQIILDHFPAGVNYCWLSEFDRYYYLTDVDFINGQYITKWHVDVLMSFKDDIKRNKSLIQRNTNYNDLYLQDNEFKIEQYTNDRYLKFNSTPFSISTNTFLMGVLGG